MLRDLWKPVLLLGMGLMASCATTQEKTRKEVNQDDFRVSGPKNFGLYQSKDIEWKFIERGKKEVGAPWFDSY